MHKENVLFRVLRPIKEKLGIPVLNFQILRRTDGNVQSTRQDQ